MKTKIAAAASPGSASGRMIRTTAESRLQPSVIAASSSSTEMPAKTLEVTSTANGQRERGVRDRDPVARVSSIPQRRKITASGIERITIGKARVATTPRRNASAPRNAKRASA